MKEHITDMVDRNRYDLMIEMAENDLLDLIEICHGVDSTPDALAAQFFKDLLGSCDGSDRTQLAAKWFKLLIRDRLLG